MKTQWNKIFAAAVVVSAAPANAIPVTFDFSGTVAQVVVTDFTTPGSTPTFDLSTAGQAFSAQFVVDTDLFGLAFTGPSELGDRLTFTSDLPGAITPSFMINGESIEIAPFSGNRAIAGFLDSYGIVSSRLAPDQFNVTALSEDSTPRGPAASRALSFSFVAGSQGFENPESALTWFDFSPGFGLDQIASLPLLESLRVGVTLTDSLFDCSGEQCRATEFRRTMFNVTSATRAVASVPEPATLGLLALGIAAAMSTRRRQPQRV
ncbi:MAG TPA: PEP-CTERM sorting domain-containing protein [Steroidobacteraceae bacterium]|nr:PEP-CTERM sorting domain-containing protein [Steroidobacteraceae bacterium]